MTPGRISIIWPYWMRGEAMERGFDSMWQHYRNEDVEIVVVDDGSPEDKARDRIPFKIAGIWHDVTPLKVKLVELPIKHGPLNPCVPINRGVAASTGEFIVLTNPETTHRQPLLAEMRRAIENMGPKTYAHAAVWCPQSGSWHTHSSLVNAYHFLGMMRRSLWDEIGGFDGEYRDGYCFDDPDFLQRALRAGAKIAWLDHLVADHHQDLDAKHFQPRELWDRNHAMFWRKWPTPMSVTGEALTFQQLQNWAPA